MAVLGAHGLNAAQSHSQLKGLTCFGGPISDGIQYQWLQKKLEVFSCSCMSFQQTAEDWPVQGILYSLHGGTRG